MRRIHVPALMFAALASAAWAQAPQDAPRDLPAITADLERIKADLETVKSQLAQVLRVLSQRPAQGGVAVSGPVRTSVADAPMLGRADAPVTLVEFSDYQCPFCQRFFATTLPALKREYIDAGKIRYVFRDYPLEMHALARQAAEATPCSRIRGRWPRRSLRSGLARSAWTARRSRRASGPDGTRDGSRAASWTAPPPASRAHPGSWWEGRRRATSWRALRSEVPSLWNRSAGSSISYSRTR